MSKVFSGIQPTNNLTIGNYLGAMKNWLIMQDQHECIYCIVDLHALTNIKDAKALDNSSLTNLALYLATGLDPAKSIIFKQSSVIEHTLLSWILSCITPIGWLNRMTQFKDKAGKDKEKANLGLYAYPVLMAADILLYHTQLVPVGDDQLQHLELTRDIALAFNRKYETDYFQEPKAMVLGDTSRIMSLKDGTKKMSKSDPSDFSRINMLDSADLILSKIKKATSDSIEGIYYDAENRPEISNLISIYSGFSNISIEDLNNKFSGYSTQKFKQELADLVVSHLKPIQEKTNHYISDKAELLRIESLGAQKARDIASKTITEIRKISGL